MKVFDIETSYTYAQKHCVVANTAGEAERVFLAKYPGTTINAILLHSEYVEISPEAKP